MVKKIDHIAIAVRDLELGIKRYRDILGLALERVETIASQKVKVAIFTLGDLRIELLEPLSEDSPISRFLATRAGGIHHIAYEVDHIQETADTLKQQGVRLLGSSPSPGASGSRIIFAHPDSFSGVLSEFVEPGE